MLPLVRFSHYSQVGRQAGGAAGSWAVGQPGSRAAGQPGRQVGKCACGQAIMWVSRRAGWRASEQEGRRVGGPVAERETCSWLVGNWPAGHDTRLTASCRCRRREWQPDRWR